jgi:four helix bundle protein
MPASRSFEDAEVWQKAHGWVLGVYDYSSRLPQHEMFGLTAQLRRAAVSVPGNFAEGFKKHTRPDKLRFYNIAQASLEESRYYLLLAQDLGYGDTASLRQLAETVSKMLDAYARSIREADARERSTG